MKIEETLSVVREVLHSVAQPPIVSIPDKIYAQARAEGYEQGMLDAAQIAERGWGQQSLARVLRDPGDRACVLKEYEGA